MIAISLRFMHKKTDKLWLFGKHAVLAALANPLRSHYRLLATKSNEAELRDLARAAKVQVTLATVQEFEKILPKGSIHQGVALQTSGVMLHGIEELDEALFNKKNVCLLALDQVSDQINIGSIMRSAAAFSIDGIITLADNTPEETGQIAKAACGAMEVVPLIKVVNLAKTIEYLQQRNFWTVGLDGESETILEEMVLPDKCLFVIGSEHSGMRRLTREKCDYLVKIAMSGQMESLNASVAAALAMHSFYRQKFITN